MKKWPYRYHPFNSCEKYTKWYCSHQDDMQYRINEKGKTIYTLQEILELGEIEYIERV